MISQQTILPDQSETVSIPRTTDRSAGGSPSALTSPSAAVAKAFSSCPSELIHTSEPLAGRAPMLRERATGPAGRRPHRRRRALLQPDLVLVVVLSNEIVVWPVREAVWHQQSGVLLLRLDHLPVELVLGRVRLPELVPRRWEPLVQLVRRLD